MIRRVKITGYKSLRSAEVYFKPLTIVFGPNAAGKSNLFDALALLSRMVTQRSLREAFEPHRGAPLEAFFAGDGGIEHILQQKTAEFRMEVDVELSQGVVDAVERRIQEMRSGLTEDEGSAPRSKRIFYRFLRYSLSVEIMTETGHLRVKDECLRALNNDSSEKLTRSAFVERIGDHFSLRVEGQAHPSKHEIGLDHTLASAPLYAPHYPHITAFREELSRWRFYYLEPKSLMRRSAPLQEVESLDTEGANLAAFYNSLKVNNPRQFDNVNRAISLLLPRVERIDVDRSKLGELQLSVYESGVPFPARLVSEGTLRILGLLAITAALTPASVVGFEEPENGVHPQRLKLIADLLKNAAEATETQFLINTHSPEFPEFFGPDAALINCRRDGACTTFQSAAVARMFRGSAIEDGLTENEEVDAATLSERIRRGDYGG